VLAKVIGQRFKREINFNGNSGIKLVARFYLGIEAGIMGDAIQQKGV